MEETSKEVSNKYFVPNFVGEIGLRPLEKFLINEISLVFAMGTSALEAAKLKIPAVLLDLSYEKIEGDYIFKSLYDSEGFNLAEVITVNNFKKNNDSLQIILKKLRENYYTESEKHFSYYKENHSIDKVGKIFLKYVKGCNVTYHKLKKNNLLRPRFIIRLYSYIMRFI